MPFFTVVSYKGGVAKTTTAVHLAAYLHRRFGSTVLIDGDQNHSATDWAKPGGFPFPVVDVKRSAYEARKYRYVVIDTEARPGGEDLKELAEGCDFLIIPAVPATLETLALIRTLNAATELGLSHDKFRVLMTKVPPPPEPEGPDLRRTLEAEGYPVFAAEIPRLKIFDHAVAAGVPVYDATKNIRAARRGWEAYEAAWGEIEHMIQPAATQAAE